MALQIEFVGSGEFVPVRVWSCPFHDTDVSGYEDDPWERPGEICLDCEMGLWRDERDVDGNVVMRELSMWEWGFRQIVESDGMLAATTEYILRPNVSAKIEWLDDELAPLVAARAGE